MSKTKSPRSRQKSYGGMNSHTVGRLMKEAAWRAMQLIGDRIDNMVVTAKETPGKMNDLFTDADEDAQRIYRELIEESFPTYGVIGEEGKLRIPCRNKRGLCFSLDPIDGTNAFVRGEPFGKFGTMIALAEGGRVISAWVGDVTSEQLFGYRPGSPNTHRLVGRNASIHLTIDESQLLADQYVLLRDGPELLSINMRKLVSLDNPNRLFKKYEVYGGSIGTWAVRLWSGNIGGLIIGAGHDAPWDIWPIIGICCHMGFVFLRFYRGKLVPVELPVTDKTVYRPFEVLVVHQSRLSELCSKGLMFCRGVRVVGV